MRAVVLAHEVDWEGFRAAARALALEGVPPEEAVWSVGAPDDLFAVGGEAPEASPAAPAFTLPRALVELAEAAIQAREPQRFALLYGLVWRTHRGERHLIGDAADPLVHRATRLARAAWRDGQAMRAFLRFREVATEGVPRHLAWFEPAHFTLEANAPFFARRFATMGWSILTPYRSAHWDGESLRYGPGADPAQVPDDDRLALYWRTYYASIFNPARLNPALMAAHMPRRYWANLPEAAAIPELVRSAPARAAQMLEAPVTSPPRPSGRSFDPPPTRPNSRLAQAAQEAAECRRCPLWQPATQVVFGEGPADARMMLVGEQPGDQEDLAGRPFVGPAGRLLDGALVEAGIDRSEVYVTNAVKHFKFVPRGRRRIHAKPDAGEIAACRFWLDLERAEVNPAMTVLMGASAARAVLGRAVTIGRERGAPVNLRDGLAIITVHPSYLLRLPDPETRQREYLAFIADLRHAAELSR